jgi:hypothetical protein
MACSTVITASVPRRTWHPVGTSDRTPGTILDARPDPSMISDPFDESRSTIQTDSDVDPTRACVFDTVAISTDTGRADGDASGATGARPITTSASSRTRRPSGRTSIAGGGTRSIGGVRSRSQG